MKNLFFAALMLFPFMAFSQQDQVEEEVFKRDRTFNEISLNALNLVAFGAVDVAYERIIDSNSSWAVEGFILALNRENEDASAAYDKDASLTGKYKYFFGDRHAWGFYVNGLAMISTGKYNDYYDNFNDSLDSWSSTEENYTDLALGFGLGGKFVAKHGFMLDLSTGIGRNLLSTNSPTIVGQFNVNLGFRF